MTTRKSLVRFGTWAAAIALGSGMVIGFGAARDGHEPAPGQAGMAPPEVSVAQVVSRDVRQWDEFTGRVSAVETVELRPRVSGYVERLAYQEGQEVRKGDLLFQIDQRSYRAAFDRARAELERARSEARLAASEYTRAQTLVDQRAISREEFDARKAAATQGNAAVRAAEAALDRARLDLEFTEVRAPIDGRAGRALVTVGNLAQADSTLLTTVVSLDPVHVYFEADEQTYLRYNELARRAGNIVNIGSVNGLAALGDAAYSAAKAGLISMTRSIAVPASSGSSPCTLTSRSISGCRRATSATRSVPLGSSGSVICTCPPKRCTSSKISSWSVATHTPTGRCARQAAS